VARRDQAQEYRISIKLENNPSENGCSILWMRKYLATNRESMVLPICRDAGRALALPVRSGNIASEFDRKRQHSGRTTGKRLSCSSISIGGRSTSVHLLWVSACRMIRTTGTFLFWLCPLPPFRFASASSRLRCAWHLQSFSFTLAGLP
jgi:hypothetical protein